MIAALILQMVIMKLKIQLISKCGIQMLAENRSNTVKHYDYSKSHIIASVEQSLKNLQTDYLDAFLLHRPSPLMQADEIAEAVEKLKNILIDVNNKLESHQRLDYILVCSDVWDIDNGLLTPTLKIKRKLILLMVFSFMIIKIPQTY